jgi:hypothetical protein
MSVCIQVAGLQMLGLPLLVQVKNANIGDKTISSDRLQGGDMNPSVSFSNGNFASGMSCW